MLPPHPPKNYKISSAFSYNFKLALTLIFIRREIGNYLLLRNQFVFFDFSQPLIYFLLDYVAVMALFAMAGYYSAKLLKRQNL